MVKVKNKLLVALSLMLCAVLLSAVMVFVNDNKNSSKITADSTVENPTAPGYYELNADGTAWELNMEWAQFKANHVTTTDGHLQVRNTSSKIITGFLVWGDMDASDPTITDLSTAFASSDCSLEWVDKTSVQSLSGIDLKKLDVSKVTTMQRMFASYDGTTNLSYLDVSNFETGLVTDMSGLFYGCSKLSNIDVSNFDTKSVKDMQAMFMSCSSLTELNLSNFSTESIEVTESYRSEDGSIVEYTGLADMFAMCSNLKTLDISGFDTSNVNETGAMSRSLYNCYKLTQIKTPKAMGDTTIPLYLEENSENHYALYSATETAITEINKGMANSVVELFDSSNNSLADTPYTGNEPDENPDQGEDKDPLSKPGYYEQVNGEWKMIKTWDEAKSSSFWNLSQGQIQFISSSYTGYLVIGDFDTAITSISYQRMSAFGDTVGLSAIDFRNFDSSSLTSMSFMGMPVSQIIFGDNFNTSKLSYMVGMFSGCLNLTSLDLSCFNTSQMTSVTAFDGMFSGCKSLTQLDISMFDFSNITDNNYIAGGSGLFQGCTNLKAIKFPKNFITSSNCSLLNNMFSGCTSLEVLDIRDWDLSSFSITPTTVFIETCTGLKRILLPDTLGGSFQLPTTSNGNYYALRSDKTTAITYVTTEHAGEIVELYDSNGNSLAPADSELDNMKFPGLYASKDSDTLILSWNKFKQYMSVTDGKLSFSLSPMGLSPLTLNGTEHLVLGKWTGDTITNLGNDSSSLYWGSFSNINLGSIDFNTFDVSNVTNMSYMFRDCESITSIEFGDNFDTSKVTDMSDMFNYCTNLTNISFGEKFNTSNVLDMSNMFYNCTNLTNIEFPNSFNTSSVTNMESMFNGCKSLTSLDLSMFNTAKVTNYSFIFNSCKELQVLNISNFEINITPNTSGITEGFDCFFGNETGFDSSSFTTADTRCTSLKVLYGPKVIAENLLPVPIAQNWGMNPEAKPWKDLQTDEFYTDVFPEATGESHTFILQDGTAITIALNPNGGVVSGSNVKIIVRLAEMEYGKLPIPTCAGKKFLGWYTALEGGDLITETTLVPTVSSGETITIYAHWADEDLQGVYTITYKANGGVGEDVIANTAENGVFVTKEGTLFTRNGYTFAGWSTNPDKLEGNYQNASTSFTTTENLTLYAIWTKVETSSIDMPNTWRDEYKTQTNNNCATITSIIFTRTLPDGYNSTPVATLTGGLQVYANSADSSKIAFVFDGIIYAPEDSSYLFDFEYYDQDTYMNVPSSLNLITFENFDTSKVKNMESMFFANSQLTNLDVSNFNTSLVENMNSLFRRCSNLTSLNLTNFDTSSVEDMQAMFMDCSALTQINVSSFNTANVKYFDDMFAMCSNLETLDLSSFDMRKASVKTSEMGYNFVNAMISYCENLTTIISPKYVPTYTIDASSASICNLFKLPTTQWGTSKYTWYDQVSQQKIIYMTITNGTSHTLVRVDAEKYTITYNSNNGTGKTKSQEVAENNEFNTLSSSTFTMTGYTIKGWSTDPNVLTGNYQGVSSRYNYVESSDITLYAIWEANTYNVYYRSNGGRGTMSFVKHTYGEPKALTKNKFTKTNYEFVEWNTKTDGSGTSYKDEESVVNLSTGSSVYLYAIWKAVDYTITYNDVDNADTLEPKTYNIETATFNLPTPTKAGYNFLGWTGEGITTPTKEVTITKGTTGNKTYTANWELARKEIADVTVSNGGKAYEYTDNNTNYSNAIGTLVDGISGSVTISKVNQNVEIFDLVATDGEQVTISIANAEVKDANNVHIMHYNGTAWEDVTSKAASVEYDNDQKVLTIQMQLDSYSPIVVVEATADAIDTPETGIVANSISILVAMVSLLGMGYVVSKKKRLSK